MDSTDFDDKAMPKITGHVLIRDPESGLVLLDKKNAVHYENMSLAVAYSMAANSAGFISEMHFGNGGSAVSGTGAITYFPTNTNDPQADLYDPTYSKRVNKEMYPELEGNNYIEVKHILGTPYTDIIVTCTLEYNEPSGQEAMDTSADSNGDFVFDELGLKTKDNMLLTHVIFNPIQKALNRLIEVVYTLRIQMS
jgi:hypothetical protein